MYNNRVLSIRIYCVCVLIYVSSVSISFSRYLHDRVAIRKAKNWSRQGPAQIGSPANGESYRVVVSTTWMRRKLCHKLYCRSLRAVAAVRRLHFSWEERNFYAFYTLFNIHAVVPSTELDVFVCYAVSWYVLLHCILVRWGWVGATAMTLLPVSICRCVAEKMKYFIWNFYDFVDKFYCRQFLIYIAETVYDAVWLCGVVKENAIRECFDKLLLRCIHNSASFEWENVNRKPDTQCPDCNANIHFFSILLPRNRAMPLSKCTVEREVKQKRRRNAHMEFPFRVCEWEKAEAEVISRRNPFVHLQNF